MAKAVKTSKIEVPVSSWTFRLEDCVLRFHEGVNINAYGVTEEVEKAFAKRGYGIYLNTDASNQSEGPHAEQSVVVFSLDTKLKSDYKLATGRNYAGRAVESYEIKNGQTFTFPVSARIIG